MKLHDLRPKVARKDRKRRGQGNGSGNGTFGGRGCKGQNARSGGGVRLGFEGGQTPLIQRMPKQRGFRSPNKIVAHPVNLAKLENTFADGDTVNMDALITKKIIRKNASKAKILGFGELTKKLTIAEDVLVSATAKEAVKKAGGSVNEPKKEEKK